MTDSLNIFMLDRTGQKFSEFAGQTGAPRTPPADRDADRRDRLWDWFLQSAGLGRSARRQSENESDLSALVPIEPSLLPSLTPARPGPNSDWCLQFLNQISTADLERKGAPAATATALKAGLFLWHDYLDECHQLSQSVEGEGEYKLGDYWHAILHRREPDYSNAKYWFRQIGRQPVFGDLGRRADKILADCPEAAAGEWLGRLQKQGGGGWDSFAFVDLCERCAGDQTTPLAVAARRIQLEEMAMLLKFTWDRVVAHKSAGSH